jgi:hypothetical protein
MIPWRNQKREKRKGKNPLPWLSSFNERKFEPFIRAIGQSTLLWNDLHESLGHLYCTAVGGGFVNVHFRVWNSIANDRAKRDMLLAAAEYTFVDEKGRVPISAVARSPRRPGPAAGLMIADIATVETLLGETGNQPPLALAEQMLTALYAALASSDNMWPKVRAGIFRPRGLCLEAVAEVGKPTMKPLRLIRRLARSARPISFARSCCDFVSRQAGCAKNTSGGRNFLDNKSAIGTATYPRQRLPSTIPYGAVWPDPGSCCRLSVVGG